LRAEFRKNIGFPLKKWLIQARALEVRRRLNGSEGIKEIALSVGFSHSKELSREFKRIYNITPSEFRKNELRRSAM
jgi:AraC-like DNA-binding protein